MLTLTDADLITRLRNIEDQFVERKSKSDKGGWLRTVVAFANSLPVGYPGILFVGVDDDGNVTENGNVEDLLKAFSGFIKDHTWPPVYCLPRVIRHGGRSCIGVVVPGSENRPHFAGKSYIRLGTETREASEDQFDRLIADRQSKVREIRKHISEVVIVEQGASQAGRVLRSEAPWLLQDCNGFYVTVCLTNDPHTKQSFPLNRVSLSFDYNRNVFRLQIAPLD
jgi:predicted HTH transcriptional regulator